MLNWIAVTDEEPPKDGQGYLFCRNTSADGFPIDPGTMSQVFFQVAQWWPRGGGGEGRWVVYCSIPQEPTLHFEPTHWARPSFPLGTVQVRR